MKAKRGLAVVLSIAMILSGSRPVMAAPENETKISIDSAEELLKIGTQDDYPMDGDYVLTEDIDLSEMAFQPIGGYKGIKGTTDPAGENVFSGTFDGDGHVISGMKIDLDGSVKGENQYGQVGFFSVVAGASEAERAVVENLIFTDVDIRTDFSDGFAAVGSVAGEVNGYATIQNVAVLNGTMTVNPSAKCDTVGAGGVIGECRTADTAVGNGNIEIRDIYSGTDLSASGSRSDLVYAGGIIGRVAKSSCKEITRCVGTGTIQYDGYDAYGISGAEGSNSTLLETVSDCYYLDNGAQTLTAGAVAVSADTLQAGKLLSDAFSENWEAKEGCDIVPSICYQSKAAGYVYLSSVSLTFAEGESASAVKTVITLPQQAGSEALTWSSSRPELLVIADGMATAAADTIGTAQNVVITVTSASGYSRSFQVTVLPEHERKAEFDADYAKPGTPLKVSVADTSDPSVLSYAWRIGGGAVVSTTDTYTPSESDLEKFITVTVTDSSQDLTWELQTYCSELPVVYVSTEDGKDVTSNTTAKNATIRLQGNDEFSDPQYLYEGATTIKGRGNSTWSAAVSSGVKKPYKLKLASKQNLYGLGSGENKHWVLLANMIDHTNMRNEIVSRFAKEIGMEYVPATTDVVLILNGEYQGVYQICEHVRVGTARVNVFDWENLADDIAKKIAKKEKEVDRDALETAMEQDYSWVTSGTVSFAGKEYTITDYYKDTIPDFTGGFLLDMDFRSTSDVYKYVSTFRTDNGIPMFFRAPEYAKTSDTMMQFASDYLNAYEAALKSPDFTTQYQGKTVHYTDLFDMDSLLQYWMVCEFTNNWDSMKNSSYLYKDLEGKAKMGPVWDYDWAFGNINMYSMTGPFVWDNWHTVLDGISTWNGGFMEQEYQGQQWYRYLVKDPYFITKAWEMYQKIRPGVLNDMIKDGGIIDTMEQKYQTASEANDAKWSYSYGNYSGIAFVNGKETRTISQDYQASVESLKTFITKRTGWMDTQFTSPEELYASLGGSVSEKIAVTAEKQADDWYAKAEVSDSQANCAQIVVNGKTLTGTDGETRISLQNGKVHVRIPEAYLEEDSPYQTIQVITYRTASATASSGMNFVVFDKTKSGSGTEKPGSGEESGSGTEKPGSGEESGSGTEKPGSGEESGSGTVTPGSGDNSGSGTVTPGNGTETPGSGNTTGTDTGTGSAEQAAKAEQIRITGISHKIAAGRRIVLQAQVTPAEADQTVRWSSSNTKYAAVSAGGKVTLKKAGAGKTVRITAEAADGSGITAVYKISIKKHAVKRVQILSAEKKPAAGKSFRLKTRVQTTGRQANTQLQYYSSNPAYATVDAKGKVTAKKAGKGKKVRITARATDGSGKKAVVTIRIR